MTRPHLITRLMLVAAGIHLLMRSLSGIGSVVLTLSQKCPPETFTIKLLILTAKLVITFALSLILLFRPDGLIRMIAGPDDFQSEKVNELWVIAGFRLTACFCGLLILYHRIELLFYYVPTFKHSILSYMTLEGQSSLLSTKTLTGIITEITKWIIAIYFIFGASHYVRWQMKTIKVKEQNQFGGAEQNEQK